MSSTAHEGMRTGMLVNEGISKSSGGSQRQMLYLMKLGVCLLALNAVLVGGLVFGVLIFVAKMEPIVVNAGNILDKAGNLRIMPYSFADTVDGVLGLDLGNIAGTVDGIATSATKAMTALNFADEGEAQTYASFATLFQSTHEVLAPFKTWKRANDSPPPDLGILDILLGVTEDKKLLPSLTAWLVSQFDEEKLQRVGNTCNAFHKSLQTTALDTVVLTQWCPVQGPGGYVLQEASSCYPPSTNSTPAANPPLIPPQTWASIKEGVLHACQALDHFAKTPTAQAH